MTALILDMGIAYALFPDQLQSYQSSDRAAVVCAELHRHTPSSVLLPNSQEYAHLSQSYWTAQQEHDFQPACRLRPPTPEILAPMLRLIVEERVPFAIKSGGHSSVPGASNINASGIAIDLSSMCDVNVSDDRSAAKIGVGAKWYDVYRELERQDLSVVGARAGGVGVGGFILGGGVSWHSNQFGWACDAVEEFQVILADGRVIAANSESHADLFWALKGGGSLFGVVVTVRLRTIPRTDLFGGALSYDPSQRPGLLAAVVDLSRRMTKNTHLGGYLCFAATPQLAQIMHVAMIVDLTGRDDSALLKPFTQLPHQGPPFRSMNMSDSVLDISVSNPSGFCQTKFTLTLHPDPSLLEEIYQVFTSFAKSTAVEENGHIGMSYQPLSSAHLSHNDNALGFSASDEGPLILLSLEIKWASRSHDLYFERVARELHDAMANATSRKGMLHRYIYANYAAGYQDPYKSYGAQAVRRLSAVQQLYDPRHLFMELQPGAFKLPPP